MQPGDTVQSSKYKRKKYKGRLVKIIDIQNDIDDKESIVSCIILDKNKKETKAIAFVKKKTLEVIKCHKQYTN